MLTISRKNGQSIVLGDPDDPLAVITINRAFCGKCRVSIAAPKRIQINRLELIEQLAEPAADGRPDELTAGVAETTLGAGEHGLPLLRLGPGGAFTQDIYP